MADRVPPTLEVRLAAVLHPWRGVASEREVRDRVARLKFTNRTAATVAAYLTHWPQPEWLDASDAQLRRWLAAASPPLVPALLDLFEAQGNDKTLRGRVEALLAARPALDVSALALSGSQIMSALGVGPSPEVGKAARYLLDAVLDKPELNSEQELTRLLASWKPT